MPVPEAAVDEDNLAVPGKNDIGAAGKVLAMKSKPVTALMQNRPDDKFRPRILAANAAHE